MTYLAILWSSVALLSLLGAAASFPLRFSRVVFIALGASAGIGAYTLAWLTTKAGWPPAAALATASVVGFGLGLMMGAAAASIRGAAFILFLLAIQVIAEQSLYPVRYWTNGTNGIEGIPGLWGSGIAARAWTAGFLAAALTVLVAIIYHRLDKSPLGLCARAFADDHEALARLQINPRPALQWIFAIACSIAGFAGGVAGLASGLVTPGDIGIAVSLSGAAVALLAERLKLPWLLGIFCAAVCFVALRFIFDTLTARFAVLAGDRGWQLHYLREILIAGITIWLLLPQRKAGSVKGDQPDNGAGHSLPANFGCDPQLQKPASTAVYLRDAAVDVDGTRIVADLNAVVQPGEVLALVGPNGCGKTTALRLLGSQRQPSAGVVQPAPANQAIYVSGNAQPFPGLSVVENLTLALNAGRTDIVTAAAGVDERTRLALQQWLLGLHLMHRAAAPAEQLSWGQSRRLLLAMTLSSRPWPYVFLDEPVAGLDPYGRKFLGGCLLELQERGTVVAIAEHDLEFVRQVATRCLEFGPPVVPPLRGTRTTGRHEVPLFECADLDVGYVDHEVVSGVCLGIHANQLILVTGGNGAGKSTLLRTLSQLIPPLRGKLVSGLRRGSGGIAYVGATRLFSGKTVGYHLDQAESLAHRQWKNRDRYGLWRMTWSLRDRIVETLSDGQQRWVRVALALLQGPELLILDEPSLNLSPIRLNELIDDICLFAAEEDCGVIVADHAADQWKPVCDLHYEVQDHAWKRIADLPLQKAAAAVLSTDRLPHSGEVPDR